LQVVKSQQEKLKFKLHIQGSMDTGKSSTCVLHVSDTNMPPTQLLACPCGVRIFYFKHDQDMYETQLGHDNEKKSGTSNNLA
jgi:hypothetical protein